MPLFEIVAYGLPITLIVAWYWRSHSRRESSSLDVLVSATEQGMIEPPTLHPEIDHSKCIGCRSCVAACPEQYAHTVLGMIGVFEVIAVSGNDDAQAMARGVYRATIPTMAGLVVALTGIYFTVRLKRLADRETSHLKGALTLHEQPVRGVR